MRGWRRVSPIPAPRKCISSPRSMRCRGIRPVLCLFEGVVTGAADGYGRMAEKPAATLLHLGPGFGNGWANLHNARRAATPLLNIVGDHATYHAQYDAPLASDVTGLARTVSGWVHSSVSPRTVAADGARAVQAAMAAPGPDRDPDPAGRYGLARGRRRLAGPAGTGAGAGLLRCGRSHRQGFEDRQAHGDPDARRRAQGKGPARPPAASPPPAARG